MISLKTGLRVTALVLVTVIAVVLVRTWRFTPPVVNTHASTKLIEVDANTVAGHLGEAIRFATISNDDRAARNDATFDAFGSWLATTYPEVHSQLALTHINKYTLLFHWQGKQQSAPAILLSAHYDVVPVNPGTEGDWVHPPFAGVVDDTTIWGRGALDDKSAVIALMETTTLLLKQGFTPDSDIYIALTHDEEIGSEEGSKGVRDYFTGNTIPLAWSLDEGSFVLEGLVPGVDKGIASINVAEKGYLTLELTAHGKGGHSSMPPHDTAVSLLAEAIVNLKNAPVPGGLNGLSEQMYQNIARHMSFTKRMLFANTWLFKPLIESSLADSPSGNAMLRTTTAPTMLNGSIKANVLPATATAKVNFRVHPRDSVASVIAWVTQAIDNPDIDIAIVQGSEPSPVAASDNKAFAALADAATAVHGDVIVTPGITIAATDSRYYSDITDAYRFNPMTLTPQDFEGFHGTNEKISKQNMVKAVQFYARLMQAQ